MQASVLGTLGYLEGGALAGMVFATRHITVQYIQDGKGICHFAACHGI